MQAWTLAQNTYVGAVRAAGGPPFATGWSWVDGTPATNLNCLTIGCLLWEPTTPRSEPAVCTAAGRGLQGND